MSDPRYLAKALRDVSQAGGDAGDRRRAMLHLLKKEFDELPTDAVMALLAQVRAEVAPGDEASEASHLWECVAGAAPATSSAGSAVASEVAARKVLGEETVPAGSFSPEKAERWDRVVEVVFETLLRYEAEFQKLYLRLKTESTSATGASSFGIRLEKPILKLVEDVVEGRRDVDELESRLKRFGLATLFMYDAYVASATSLRESVRRLIDPHVIQESAPAKDYWTHYRKMYRQELYDFGPTFTTIFVKPPFLDALLKALKNI